MNKKSELYRKISFKKGRGVKIKPNLCFYTPKEVYKAVTQNPNVVKWLNFISNHYLPPVGKEVLLIYPCSNEKPYHKSRSYRTLFRTLDALGNQRKAIHLMTVSEPFGLIPEEFYEDRSEWYDCPGLFEWWCAKYGQPYSQEYVDKSIECLADYISKFFLKSKSKKCYSKIIAFIRTYTSQLQTKEDHTHRRIIEKAAEIAEVEIEILPDRRLVSKIVRNRGRMAWDMYGVAHPLAQEYLLKYLKGVLNGTRN
ncbi:MAG: DUF5591 domain-containing protein [Candidatus Bathyarchaeia archaeon]